MINQLQPRFPRRLARPWPAVPSGPAPVAAHVGLGMEADLHSPPVEQWRPRTEDLVRKYKIQHEIDRTKSLSLGWDGYAAQPPSRTAGEVALRALDLLYSMQSLPLRAVPLADGGVALVIMARPYYAAVEVYNDGEAAVVFSDRKERQLAWEVSVEGEQLRPAIARLHELMHG